MPPRYPFSRNVPPTSSNTTPQQVNQSTHQSRNEDRTIVVSASGVAPNSPAAGLTADSPSTLRSRIPSPGNPLTGFTSNSSSYPSPQSVLQQGTSRLLSLGKKKGPTKNGKGGKGWMMVDTESPTKDVRSLSASTSRDGRDSSVSVPRLDGIPRFDARGYPLKESPKNFGHSYSNSKSTLLSKDSQGFHESGSSDSIASSSSSTLADSGRYSSDHVLPYVPCQHDQYQQPPMPHPDPYQPTYDNHIYGQTPSIYTESRFSVATSGSEKSMTHFHKYDALKDAYSSHSISSKGGQRHLADLFHLPADPTTWSYLGPEPDDDFHDPDYKATRTSHSRGILIFQRGALNIGCLFIIFTMLLMLFAGYPVLIYYLRPIVHSQGGYNLGGINSTGQIPNIGPFQLIDKDTPQSAFTHQSLETGQSWELVFSDEFNNDGRTFFDGDDPYWQAVDLHYWQTNNLEWYDPSMLTTKNGSLVMVLDKIPNHGLDYTGGMMSTWNRFCFTGGYVEASVSLPGTSNVYGLWPAIWTMGNLGRAGYGGSLDGLWPYSYDSCDVGTLPNQTLNGRPEISLTSGDGAHNSTLSYLPGQRLSRCTCENDDTHPGPKLPNGTWVGRNAPEIDMFEATVNAKNLIGEVSQSAQWAPFNPNYDFINTTSTYDIYDDVVTELNTYQGSAYQQATSALSKTDQNCYTQDTGCFSIYGFEYAPGSDGYITWINNNKKSWTVRGSSMGPNDDAQVGQRLVSMEPMYLIVNLGLSENFGAIDFDGLEALWPVRMEVDYIRVYQDPSKRNIGCDPDDYPTAKYIEKYAEAYSNPNITIWKDIPNAGAKPKNTLVDTC